MTRIGINPARHRVSDYRPARITLAMLVYMPHLTGYFENRLDVVRLSLASMLRHADLPYDLLVFDNASCDEAQQYLRRLQEEGAVRYLLTSSENIGKLGALRLIAGAAPGELVAYADDDTFFYPGWLSAHVALLDGFPNVGMVSGSPEKTLFDHGIDATLRYGQTDPETELTRGHRIPEVWEREWAEALGKDPADFLAHVREIQDIRLRRRGLEAYATACHNQFVAPRDVLRRLLDGEWSGRLMGGLNELDNGFDAMGFLRLTTTDRTTRLIGNILAPPILVEAGRFGIDIGGRRQPDLMRRPRPWLARLARKGPARRLLQGLYNRLFWILTGESTRWLEPGGRAEDKGQG
jgi:glycosyltransferase involved in cell wall biosynthesis